MSKSLLLLIAACMLCYTALLGACAAPTAPQATLQPVPTGFTIGTDISGYVLAGENEAQGFRNNQIALFEFAASSVAVNRLLLHQSAVHDFAQDAAGNIWLGYAGGMDFSDDRVQILNDRLEQVQEIHPCENPDGAIRFSAHWSFVICSENGFAGTVAVLDPSSYAVSATVTLELGDNPFLITASAINDSYLVVAGLTSGPEDTSYTALFVIDVNTHQIIDRLGPLPDTDIWTILPYRDEFLLLNVGSWHAPAGEANDLLQLVPGSSSSLTAMPFFPSPLWGVIVDDTLYAFHDQSFNQPNELAQRWVSKLDLPTNQAERWPLPDGWNAGDVDFAAGKLLLTHWEGNSDDVDGVYSFDFETTRLRLLTNMADASRLLVTK